MTSLPLVEVEIIKKIFSFFYTIYELEHSLELTAENYGYYNWLMLTPILATKLYIPRLRPNVVSRPGLLERLNEGLHRNLILISAPAGFGKSTLVSEWVVGCERPATRL